MSMVLRKPTAFIYDWHIQFGNRLVGRISEHPRQEEFTRPFQVTSPVIRWDFNLGIAETLNTIYILGRRQDEQTSTVRRLTGLLIHELW
jgi:hypothetical protein